MDFNQVFNQQVEHLAKMAMQKGWVAYAKKRAEDLEEKHPDLFAGLIEAVRERVNERK